MKYLKTFENFEYLLEAEEVQGATPKEQEEIIKATAAAVKAKMPIKSPFSQKLKSKVAQAQSQKEPETTKESYIFENVEGGEILTKDNIQKYADALVKKLPILYSGDREVIFYTNSGAKKVPIPKGAEYEAYEANVSAGGLTVRYKDNAEKYKEVIIQFNPSKEELEHITKIYSDFGKNLASELVSKQKLSKFLSTGAKILAPLGVIAAIGGMVTNIFHGSPSDAYREIPTIVIAGGAAIGAASAMYGAGSVISKKIDVAEDTIVMFTALIKAFCDSLDMNIMEIKTVGDIESLFAIEKVEVEVQDATTSGKVESVGNRLKGFKRF